MPGGEALRTMRSRCFAAHCCWTRCSRARPCGDLRWMRHRNGSGWLKLSGERGSRRGTARVWLDSVRRDRSRAVGGGEPVSRGAVGATDAGSLPGRSNAGSAPHLRLGTKVFVDELGIEPGPLLQGLERSVLMQMRLARLPGSDRPDAFPSVPSVAAPIIGREMDLRRCVDGPLGHGTSLSTARQGLARPVLAQEMCRLADVERSVIWVDLARTRRSGRALALTIGSPPDSSQSHLIRTAQWVTSARRVRQHAEHVGAPVEEVVSLLRSSLPELEVLVTSRVRPALGAAYLDLKRLPVPTTEGSDDGFEANASVRLLRSALAELAPAVELSRRGDSADLRPLRRAPIDPQTRRRQFAHARRRRENSLVEVAVGSQYAPIVMATLSLLPDIATACVRVVEHRSRVCSTCNSAQPSLGYRSTISL